MKVLLVVIETIAIFAMAIFLTWIGLFGLMCIFLVVSSWLLNVNVIFCL